MALDDLDYQAHPYVYGTRPGGYLDMAGPIREAARNTLKDVAGTPLHYLEIGIWEGRSGCWMLDNVLTHPLSTYLGIDDFDRTSWHGIEDTARANLAYHGAKVTVISGDSRIFVPPLARVFDIILVDGGHDFECCYADLCNVWPKLVAQGVLIVDDYAYPGLPGVPQAVDKFVSERHDAQLLHKGVAIAFRKVVA